MNLTKIPRLMQSLGDAYDSTIILSMALCAISPEKEAAQIGHLSAHKRKQFRVAHPLILDGESLSKIGG